LLGDGEVPERVGKMEEPHIYKGMIAEPGAFDDVQGHVRRSDWNIGLCEARISVVKEKKISEERKAFLLRGYYDALEEMKIEKEKWINHISQK
jgi:hypothetical protein